MKILVAIVLAGLVGSVPVAAQHAYDGTWWLQMSAKDGDPVGEMQQLMFIDGFIVGRWVGGNNVESNIEIERLKTDPCAVAVVKAREKSEAYIHDITVGQVRTGLNDFYKDYRNRSIRVHLAIDVVLRSIKGENVDQLILELRREPK